MFQSDNLALNLPDVLAKDKDSNNYKLLMLRKRMTDRIAEIHQGVMDCLDINKCNGVTLDLWGRKYLASRGTSTDEQFLLKIKAKQRQFLCDGTHSKIVSALAYMLSCKESDIKIRNGEAKNTVEVVNIPLGVIANSDFSTDDVTDVINSLLCAGVTASTINFGGTFVLTEIGAEQNEEIGLSDIAGTFGGKLGQIGV